MRNVLLVVAIFFVCRPAFAQTQPKPWFASIDFGEAQTRLSSDQATGTYHPTFALGFTAGHRLGDRFRIGGQLNGQLLQAFNLNDPTVGESVSHVFVIADVFPIRNRGLFLRGGTGLSFYSNNQPNGYGGHGPGWTFGAGYEIPVRSQFAIAPTFDYTAGHLNDRRDIVPIQSGRTFSVIEFKLAFIFHFGKE